jgi:hypothetical protein
MAVLKKNSILFSGGREIKVPGGILSITRSLELADYFSRNVLYYEREHKKNKEIEPVGNIHNLTKDELIEVSDCMIQLWMELKDNVRRHGITSEDIFRKRV